MQQLEFVTNLLVSLVLSGIAGIIIGQLLPSRVSSLKVATWGFFGAWACTVTLAVVVSLIYAYVGEPSQFIPTWAVYGCICLYSFTAGITRGIDLRAAGFWRWFPNTPVLRN